MFFYDPSVVDGTDEDDAARALRDAEETSCCATCFLIDVRKHMVSKKKNFIILLQLRQRRRLQCRAQ